MKVSANIGRLIWHAQSWVDRLTIASVVALFIWVLAACIWIFVIRPIGEDIAFQETDIKALRVAYARESREAELQSETGSFVSNFPIYTSKRAQIEVFYQLASHYKVALTSMSLSDYELLEAGLIKQQIDFQMTAEFMAFRAYIDGLLKANENMGCDSVAFNRSSDRDANQFEFSMECDLIYRMGAMGEIIQ